MAKQYPLAKVSELPPGEMKLVVANRERLLLANVDGVFHLISDTCTHKRTSLSQGMLEDALVECPLHFARFDVRTGAFIDGPYTTNVARYEATVRGDTVYVEMDS